jgi:hypothetical protein
LNQSRGKGDVGYRAGERVLIKPNWVGLIYREGHVNTETYRFIRRQDYMNTAPHMILAVVRQLASVGVRPRDITVSDTLACVVHEYYDLLHGAFADVRCEDCAGRFERPRRGLPRRRSTGAAARKGRPRTTCPRPLPRPST